MGSLSTDFQIREDDLGPAQALAPAAAVAAGGGGGGAAPAALQPLIGPEAEQGLQVQDGAGGRGDLRRAALWQLVAELRDRRLGASFFFLTWGCSTVICGAHINPNANPELLFMGFALLTTGAVLAQLTLAGGRAARAAARLEEFLRGFF